MLLPGAVRLVKFAGLGQPNENRLGPDAGEAFWRVCYIWGPCRGSPLWAICRPTVISLIRWHFNRFTRPCPPIRILILEYSRVPVPVAGLTGT